MKTNATICFTVLDENGQPLPGALVFIAGTDYHAITGADGKACLTFPKSLFQDNKSVKISHIGFITWVKNLSEFEDIDEVTVQLELSTT